jgi:serine/threonine-protein kinase
MGLSGGHVFLAMEFVRHRPFEDLVQNVSSGTRRRAACVIACQVLEALAYAHERGLVHRDVKPENVLLSRSGRKLVSKLADFGLAKKYTDAGFSQISRDGDVAGSLPFMPPEQLIDSRHAKPGCDIYGLGATLYWYLSGTTPHDFTESRCRFLTVLEDPIVPLVERCPQTPAELSRIIDRALAREPAERFTSATEMRRAMVRWAGEK